MFKRLKLAVLAAIARQLDAKMAAPVDAAPDPTLAHVATDDVRQQLNNCIAAIRGIATKLDNDAGVTDVNYFALWCDAAIATAPVKIKKG